MFSWIKHGLESKANFYTKIEAYYAELTQGRIPEEMFNVVVSRVTEELHANYKRFWRKYPKSRKRYSKLKTEDINHPFIHYLITDFFEEKEVSEIEEYSLLLFKMNKEEYKQYLDRKLWYETK